MAESIFPYDDYRKFIKERVKEAGKQWGIWAQIAKSAQCQPTYLSQAMAGKVQLTPEQILGIAKYFKLNEEETDFLILLLDFSRAGTKDLRERIGKKIEKIRREREDLSKRINQPRLHLAEIESIYYSTWHWSAIHILVSIPQYQTSKAIADRMRMPIEFIEYCLHELLKHGIVTFKNNEWSLGVADIHIPRNSPMVVFHHNNWRQKAILDASNPLAQGLHFTGVYSMSRSDYQLLKEMLLEFMDKSKQVISSSKEELLVSLLIDYFEV